MRPSCAAATDGIAAVHEVVGLRNETSDRARTTRSLPDRDGVPNPETQATVEKILGSKATVVVLKVEEEKP